MSAAAWNIGSSCAPDTLLVGGMREGLVEVRVEHAGYLGWTATGVQTRLSAGQFPDWETQELVALLQRAP